MDPEQFYTYSLRDPRVGRILAAAMDAVEPEAVIERFIHSNPLPPAERIFALGVGKAAVPMTRALCRYSNLTRGLVITKHASSLDPSVELRTSVGSATVMESGHPVPDERSFNAGHAALDFVSALQEDDLLVCLISGGGSALMTAPLVPLEDMQSLTSALLASGARIDEINTLRRHMDQVKGGGLAKATKARVLSLILSDVVGNPLEAIASGPTAPDPTTKEDAMMILEKYGLHSAHPLSRPKAFPGRATSAPGRSGMSLWQESILDSIRSATETPKPGDPIFARVQNMIVGDNALAVQAAVRQAEQEGFKAESLGSHWQGEASAVGVKLAKKLRVTKSQVHQFSAPFCLAAGGETTVTLDQDSSLQEKRRSVASKEEIPVHGSGGRNQELALAAVRELAGLEDVLLISLATDGEDGPTDAAGAVVNGETLQRAEQVGLTVAGSLSGHEAYPFFEKLEDLLILGPTGTNVNDLVFLLGF